MFPPQWLYMGVLVVMPLHAAGGWHHCHCAPVGCMLLTQGAGLLTCKVSHADQPVSCAVVVIICVCGCHHHHGHTSVGCRWASLSMCLSGLPQGACHQHRVQADVSCMVIIVCTCRCHCHCGYTSVGCRWVSSLVCLHRQTSLPLCLCVLWQVNVVIINVPQ